jgi:hypothetical protein
VQHKTLKKIFNYPMVILTFISEMQSAHDNSRVPEEMYLRFVNIATDHGLVIPA